MVREKASQWSDWDTSVIVAIAQAESHCRIDAYGDGGLAYQENGRTYGYSYGPLQVRILPGREWCEDSGSDSYWSCAHTIWQNQGYDAWSVYQNGKYLGYLQ